MKPLRSILILGSIGIIFLLTFFKFKNSETIMLVGTEVSLENPWVEFNEGDESNIGNLIRAYRFDEGEIRFKKLIANEEYLIACLRKDKSWIYYYYFKGTENSSLNKLSDKLAKEISPP